MQKAVHRTAFLAFGAGNAARLRPPFLGSPSGSAMNHYDARQIHSVFAESAPEMQKAVLRTAFLAFGAGNEARTRDLNLGKVALYQLSYSRAVVEGRDFSCPVSPVKHRRHIFRNIGRNHSDSAIEGHAARRYTTIDHIVMPAARSSNAKPIS